MVDLNQGFANPLSDEALFTWHKMPDRGGRIETIGAYRAHSDPMQVISGRIGQPKIHFEAPPSKQIDRWRRRQR
ncbi:hypothetical protein SM11_pD0375 (plasmid) [Sinorhizobium meliloti SM11]|uniref:Uncharacterized protein n=1 Tax=Sinorhizobium meliloti (strain SM11) TaxID=707241 RepID=F7XJN0_SINMM|nr:hypothetical protein SM11_pD0375 [Sinorhizobium meliloti SM11]KKA14445.1 cell filamentation protein Fic [Sinorhizobium meliloti]